MAYIGQGIKQGTFKVLDTSGNTYNGSNTTFNLGTQVGSAAQLLVSHDGVIQLPGTDYTLATGGTQITFSTAPASGASIFITEISGAVGGTVTPSDDSVTSDKIADTAVTSAKLNSAFLTGQTDIGAGIADADLFLVDDGAGGTLRKTAASRIKTYVGGFDVTSITGATALDAEPATTDEFVISDAGTLKRLDYSHIRSGQTFLAKAEFGSATGSDTVSIQNFVSSSFKKYRIYMSFSDTSDNIDCYFQFLDTSNNAITSGYYNHTFGYKNNGSSNSDEGWFDSNASSPRLFNSIDAGDKMVATAELTLFPRGQGNGHNNVLMGTIGYMQQADYLVQASMYARNTNTTDVGGIKFVLSSGVWNKVDFEVYGMKI